MTNQLNISSLSMEQLKQSQLRNGSFLGNDLIITGKTTFDTKHYTSPCRVESIVGILCTGGEIRGEINLKPYHITPGTFIICPPNNIVRVVENCDFTARLIFLSPSFVKNIRIDLEDVITLFMRSYLRPCTRLSDQETEIINHYFDLILGTLDGTEYPQKKKILQGLTMSLIYQLSRIYGKRQTDLPVDGETDIGRKQLFFEEFVGLLTLYHRRERSVGFYADALHITPKYFSTIIRKMSGKSVAEWISEAVLMDAKAMLKYSEMSIQEIAYALNFPTQSFFGKYFKRLTGLSPSEYKHK